MTADSTLRYFLACVVLLAAAAPLSAQGDQGSGEDREDQVHQRMFFDSVDVDVVNIEVVVTDKHGQPVTDLTREDFEVFEGGIKANLTNFHVVRGRTEESPDDDAAPASEAVLPADPRSNHLVILVDNSNISPQSRKLLFTKLREHLRQSSDPAARRETRQIMLVTLDRKVEVVLPFTDDIERILAALDEVERQGGSHALLDGDRRMFINRLQRARLRRFTPPQAIIQGELTRAAGDPDFDDAIRVAIELAFNVRALGEQRYQKARATIKTLRWFCEALGGMRERKALVYLSGGLPMRPADSLAEAWTGKFGNWALQNSGDIRGNSAYPNADQTFQRVISSLASSELDLRHELHQLAVDASAQQVAFYPISNYGNNPDFLSAAVGGGGISAGSGSMLRAAQMLESSTRDASLLQLAEETGGQALIRSANFGELLDRVDSDFATYYALGYSLPLAEEAEDGVEGGDQTGERDKDQVGKNDQFRRVEVKVKREGALVRHGKGYHPKNWRQRLGAMTLASALFEVDSNPLELELELGETIREGDRFRLPLLLTVPFDQIRLVYHEDRYIAQLTALVVIHNEGDGGLSEPRRIDFPIKISGRRILEVVEQLAGYVLELEMDQGPKRIAVGLRDHFSRIDATVNLDVLVGEGTS